LHHYSDAQTHAFNTPFQLAMIPPEVLRRSEIFGGKQLSDMPKDSMVSSHQLRHGDVVVFASDGVWDNLTGNDVLRIVSHHMTKSGAWEQGEKGVQIGDNLKNLTGVADSKSAHNLQGMIALAVAVNAKAASHDSKRDGPFAREVKKNFPGEQYNGGKVDDISTIVIIALEQ
jgi:protein phosphatase PTC7